MEQLIENKVEQAIEHNKYKTRFAEAPWYTILKDESYVLLLGAGGIGSWVALCLSRIGVNFTLYDMDRFEAHNMGGQFVNMGSLGNNKAEIIKELCYNFSGDDEPTEIDIKAEKFTEDSPINSIVISAFDNMQGRTIAFNKWVEYVDSCNEEEKKACLFIDGRLLAENYQIYAVTSDPERISEYRKTLFSDNELEVLLCTLKSTTHCSMSIGSDIIAILTNWATNLKYGSEIRELPFNIVKSFALFTYEILTANEHRISREEAEKNS